MSNQMWLHLQSDDSIGSPGFKAVYQGKKDLPFQEKQTDNLHSLRSRNSYGHISVPLETSVTKLHTTDIMFQQLPSCAFELPLS
ncbi:hypothetical protein lerEdw1_001378 [Lerista edwardsae]|nr:hypothetical protein lerEdw1_001378 [Lerista edwardsae]